MAFSASFGFGRNEKKPFGRALFLAGFELKKNLVKMFLIAFLNFDAIPLGLKYAHSRIS